MGQQSHQEILEHYRAELVGKRFARPLIALLVALRELALAGDFTQVEAAALVEPGDGPKLHETDRDTGQVSVSRRRVSEQLSPRDRLTPPCIQLVESYVGLHRDRAGAAAAGVTRRINTLYEAARVHADKAKDQRRQKAAEDGRRGVTWAEVKERDRRIAELETERHQTLAALGQARERVAELETRHDQQTGQLAVLSAEVTRLGERLSEQTTELEQLRIEKEQHQDQIRGLETKLLRTRAEADQQEAQIVELTGGSTGPDPRHVVREGRPADTTTGKPLGQARIRGRTLYRARGARAEIRDSIKNAAGFWVLLCCGFAVVCVVRGLPSTKVVSATLFGVIVLGVIAALIVGKDLINRHEIQFRVTEKGLRLGPGRAYAWSEIGRITRIAYFVDTEHGRTISGPPCPGCGVRADTPEAALEIRAREKRRLDDINLCYVTERKCETCTPPDTAHPRSCRKCWPHTYAPVLLNEQEWALFTAAIKVAAPRVRVIDHHLATPIKKPASPPPTT